MILPRTVSVSFFLPGYGLHSETYDVLLPDHRACWRVNAGTYMQISVVPLTYVEIADDRPKRIAAWHRLVRIRGNAGRRFDLTLRTGGN